MLLPRSAEAPAHSRQANIKIYSNSAQNANLQMV
jgi:hypothetical protein